MKTADRRSISGWFSRKSREQVSLDEIERKDSEIVLRARHNGRTCYVYLDISGQGRHYCTCRDWSWAGLGWRMRKGTVICRHLVAAALQEGQAASLLSALAG